MIPLRVIIVDDEPLARDRLRGMLRTEPGVEIVAECASGDEALAALRFATPDLLFLDMQMPGGNGLQLLERLPAGRRPAIVFATAHEQFAVEAFNVAAVDYLLKPFDRDRLRLAVQRVREHLLLARAGSSQGEGTRAIERLVVRVDGRIIFMRLEEIVWAEAADNYVILHFGTGQLMVRETLGAIESRLGGGFTRVNRSAVVQVDQIRELQPALHGDYLLVLRDGTKLPLSRALRAQFERFAPGVS